MIERRQGRLAFGLIEISECEVEIVWGILMYEQNEVHLIKQKITHTGHDLINRTTPYTFFC